MMRLLVTVSSTLSKSLGGRQHPGLHQSVENIGLGLRDPCATCLQGLTSCDWSLLSVTLSIWMVVFSASRLGSFSEYPQKAGPRP